MSRHKKILMIAPYFPPRRRVGSLRPFRFVTHLRQFGWMPTVVTLDAFPERLTHTEQTKLSGVEVIALRPWFDRTVFSESHLRESPREVVPPGRTASRFDRAFPVDTWLPVLMFHYPRLARWIKKHRPDAIWSTADPWSSHVLAMALARRFDVPWIADFRDPWTICPVRSGGRTATARRWDRWMEQKILRTADSVVFTAEQTRLAYEKHYDFPIRATTIYNSFDRCNPKRNAMPSPLSRRLDVVFFGKFRELSPARPVIQILQRLKTAHPEIFSFVRLHCFGALNSNDAAHARALGVADRFHYCAPVRPEDSIDVLRRFDILLLSTDPRRTDIVPAKLWDYLAAGRPILSLASNPEVASILHDTRSGIQFDDPDSAAEMLAQSWYAKRDGQRIPIPFDDDAAKIERFDARSATAALVNLLDSL
jgi:hypothetical protein